MWAWWRTLVTSVASNGCASTSYAPRFKASAHSRSSAVRLVTTRTDPAFRVRDKTSCQCLPANSSLQTTTGCWRFSSVVRRSSNEWAASNWTTAPRELLSAKPMAVWSPGVPATKILGWVNSFFTMVHPPMSGCFSAKTGGYKQKWRLVTLHYFWRSVKVFLRENFQFS